MADVEERERPQSKRQRRHQSGGMCQGTRTIRGVKGLCGLPPNHINHLAWENAQKHPGMWLDRLLMDGKHDEYHAYIEIAPSEEAAR